MASDASNMQFCNLTLISSNMALHETLWMKFPDFPKREDCQLFNVFYIFDPPPLRWGDDLTTISSQLRQFM